MGKMLLTVLMLAPIFSLAQETPAPHVYPAHSWTYNCDLKDPDAYSATYDRDLVEGQYKGGVDGSPCSIYRVTDADGSARRWFTLGMAVMSNAEFKNWTIAPTLGLDILRFKPYAAGLAKAGTAIYKPLGDFDLMVNVHLFGGPTFMETADIKHHYCAGFGFKLLGRFGGTIKDPDSYVAVVKDAIQEANDILKEGR